MWHTYANVMKKARVNVNDLLDIKVYSARLLNEGKEDLTQALKDMEKSDLIMLYRSSEQVWDEIEQKIKSINVPVICNAGDSILWSLSNVDMKIVAKCQTYIVYGGTENFTRMIYYVCSKVLGLNLKYEEPLKLPWEGIYHPDAKRFFPNLNDYFKWYYKIKDAPTIGMIISRGNWVNNNINTENKIIRLLEEKRYNVIPIFCYSLKDTELGTRDAGEIVKDYFFDEEGHPIIDGLVKMTSFFLTSRSKSSDYIKEEVASEGVNLLKKLNVPVFQPVISFYNTIKEWEESEQGLDRDVSWCISMPEFEGVIEPIIVAAGKQDGDIETREPILERCSHLVDRIDKWIKLSKKPVSQRKVAFILHNNPCASVEATVGCGSNLDTLESVARIMQSMKDNGYEVYPPKNGKELIHTIMDRKAISEFRWTTADEIVKKGGVLKLVPELEYEKWFDTWPEKVKQKLVEAWGKPPGEKVNEIPAAMLYQGNIIITGINYGNAVVCVQPKRGCAGTRCDGQVCKILHDPDVPPTHQYLATYRYLEKDFEADVMVHVGTHGNLEFLPGKGVGLSNSCYPDIAVGNIPHLYIYNSDNSPEGTIAKRRSYAVLVDHMQTVIMQSGLYDKLAQLDSYLGEYEKAKIGDPMRTHILEHSIIEEIKKLNLDKQIDIDNYKSFREVVEKSHEVLTIIRNSSIEDGQHIFGEVPEGDRRVKFINSILKFDSESNTSMRKAVTKMMGLNLDSLKNDKKGFCKKYGKSNGAILEEVNSVCMDFIKLLLSGYEISEASAKKILKDKFMCGEALDEVNMFLPKVMDLNKRIEESREIESLLSGFDGKYIPSGPAGLINRGRDDVLPTGRNFYSLDPYRVPTRASFKVGIKLSEKVIEKYMEEEGRYPENIAIQWMSNDIMWADGEGLSQMLYLIGTKPKWSLNGRVCGFEIIPLEELKRPRIDLTVRTSGIIRDNFSNSIELLDEAVQAVAALEEPAQKNFVRKHTLEKLNGKSDKDSFRNATLRIFASKPGTYGSGVSLAIYASAWKDEKDLADVFEYWNGYAYGKEFFGKEAFGQLRSSLKSVDITYNKVVSDDHDLFG